MKKYDLEVKQTAVTPIATKPVLTNQEKVARSGDGLSLICFGSLIVLVISILMLAKTWKVVRAKNITFNYFPKLPCRNCHFFANNHYLRCTVNPAGVLTEQSVDCPDYRPLSKN
jgi:hypothetical protein